MSTTLDFVVAALVLTGCGPSAEVAELRARQLMKIWETGDSRVLEDIASPDIVYDDVPNGERLERLDGMRRYVGHVHSWASLAGHFEVIITGGDVSRPKPEPEGVLLALRALAVTPEEAVYVGNTPVDEAMAEHAGVRFVGVKSAFTTGRFRERRPPLASVVALPTRLGWA